MVARLGSARSWAGEMAGTLVLPSHVDTCVQAILGLSWCFGVGVFIFCFLTEPTLELDQA